MIHAIVHGKVSRSVRAQEDVLTSSVFGSLDLLPARIGLGPWLRRARRLDGGYLDLSDHHLDPRQLHFWPNFSYEGGTVEPDLHIQLPDADLVVEAKYSAGPSGAPGDGERLHGQLGRQWAAARAQFGRQRPLTLLYVTADWTMPSVDMHAMIDEVERNDVALAQGFRSCLYWLSWRTLGLSLVEAEDAYQAKTTTLLRVLIERCDLGTFDEVRAPARVRRPRWRYGYLWSASLPRAPEWSYTHDERT